MASTTFNELQISTRTAATGTYYREGVGIQVLIDGIVYTEGDDYYVNIDSFFDALAQQQAVIEFIGDCHIPECCANGAWTNISPEAWLWNDSAIRLRWVDLRDAAAQMIQIIEDFSARDVQIWCANIERLPFYRQQLAMIDERITNDPSA